MKTLSMLLMAALLAALPAPALADDGPEVTLRMQEAPIRDVIQMIAEMAKVNVIVSPKVKGSVTVDFRDTPWREALETAVKSTGSALVEEDHGIYIVLPEAEARRQLEHRKAAAERRFAELEAELVAVTKRLTEAKQQAEQAETGRGELAAAQKSYEEALARLARAKRTRGVLVSSFTEREAAGPNEQIKQIYAVADLEKKLDIREVAGEVLGKDVTDISYSNGHLVVTATRAGHARLAKYLGDVRTWKTVETKLVDGRLVTTTGKTVKIRVKSDADGKPLVVRSSADGSFPTLYRTKIEWANEAALKARAEKLRQAAALLESAGDKAGAARVRDQADVALKQLTEARRKREAAAAKLAAKGGVTSFRFTQEGDLLGAVEGLRKEVGALRKDVRELTALVRKLVEQRR